MKPGLIVNEVNSNSIVHEHIYGQTIYIIDNICHQETQ